MDSTQDARPDEGGQAKGQLDQKHEAHVPQTTGSSLELETACELFGKREHFEIGSVVFGLAPFLLDST